jgi:hypothetical protein
MVEQGCGEAWVIEKRKNIAETGEDAQTVELSNS